VQELRQVLDRARNPAARVVVATFAGDEYDPNPEARAWLFRALAAPRVGGLLFLDRPAGLAGHGGGSDSAFTQRYGACMLGFVESRVAGCSQPMPAALPGTSLAMGG
jgi:hypothetical protein